MNTQSLYYQDSFASQLIWPESDRDVIYTIIHRQGKQIIVKINATSGQEIDNRKKQSEFNGKDNLQKNNQNKDEEYKQMIETYERIKKRNKIYEELLKKEGFDVNNNEDLKNREEQGEIGSLFGSQIYSDEERKNKYEEYIRGQFGERNGYSIMKEISEKATQLAQDTKDTKIQDVYSVINFYVLPNKDVIYIKSQFAYPPEIYMFVQSEDRRKEILQQQEAEKQKQQEQKKSTNEPIIFSPYEVRLTFLHEKALSKLHSFIQPEDIYYVGADDDEVHGFYFHPLNCVEEEMGNNEQNKQQESHLPHFTLNNQDQLPHTQRWPFILYIHGGPENAWLDEWSDRWNPQLLAHAGYAIFAPNFHGSDSYGQNFTDSIIGQWGGKPFDDLIKGIGAILSRKPYLDAERMAAMGASYGGYMTNWLQSQTGSIEVEEFTEEVGMLMKKDELNNEQIKDNYVFVPLSHVTNNINSNSDSSHSLPDTNVAPKVRTTVRNLFKAFITHDGLFDVASMYHETDELYFHESEFLGKPWEDGTVTNKWSPSYYIRKEQLSPEKSGRNENQKTKQVNYREIGLRRIDDEDKIVEEVTSYFKKHKDYYSTTEQINNFPSQLSNIVVRETTSIRTFSGFITPHLVIHGAMDFRVPLSQGIQMFQTLQGLGVKSRLLIFPHENHWVLNAYNSVRWHSEVLAWLQQHV
ncbi:MAG: putative S9C family peptidase [Streblomastix strix]|uniref:Putative S9C family peptidase n=1 Tax=Streblomastix strix TaxID=222440 RepID=A0A5J4V9I4_9EUKA|nr:MAG: putative S9C family peptidase [Streblomastix strix]